MTAAESAAEVVQLPELPVAEGNAECAQRVRSVTNAAETATLPGVSDTQSDRADRWRETAARAEAWLRAVIAGGSLLHAKPPSLAEIREKHSRSASRFDAHVLRVPRHAWGWLHLTWAALAYGLLWATTSPAGFVVTVIVTAVVWKTV